MIRAIVVDDEWYNLEEIADMLVETGLFEVPKKYQNPIVALEEAEQICPEVAFVDIEMPVMDGISLAKKLNHINHDIIIVFVTSWNQYAVQAFDVNALDYILKPINIARFQKMVEKVKNEITILRGRKEKSLSISCFGKLVVLIDNLPVKWERAKAEELFAFLLMHHNQYISKEVIIDNLWPGHEPQKALQILQTVVCSIRNTFSGLNSKVFIRYNQSKYCLTLTDTKCDFLEAINILDSIEHSESKELMDYVIELCKKGFLVDQGYLWSFEMEEELKKELVFKLNHLMKKDTGKQGKTKLKYLRLLAELMPYEDAVNYQLLQIYINNGRETDALKHYKWLAKILKEQYDSEPSKRIKALLQNSCLLS